MKYHKGNLVKMTPEAIENYGKKWEGVTLQITSSAHSYMSAKEFFDKGKPEGYHPGYDDGVKGQGLHDLKRADNGEPVNFSLYDWELAP